MGLCCIALGMLGGRAYGQQPGQRGHEPLAAPANYPGPATTPHQPQLRGTASAAGRGPTAGYRSTGHSPTAGRAQPAREVAVPQLTPAPLARRLAWWQQPGWLAAGALALSAGIGGYLRLGRRQQQRAFRQLRSRLADDLHDELGALLVRASFQAEALKYELPAPLATADQLLASIQEASRAMRDIAWGIDPNANTLGSLLDRMQEYVDQLPATGRCQVKITGSGIANEKAIAAATRQHIYYIFKEAVANALRHASPCTLLTIRLQQRGYHLRLQVTNDGATVADPRPGMGLRSMSRRAQEVGGHLQAAPRARGGFRVLLMVPLQSTGFFSYRRIPDFIGQRRSFWAKNTQVLALLLPRIRYWRGGPTTSDSW